MSWGFLDEHCANEFAILIDCCGNRNGRAACLGGSVCSCHPSDCGRHHWAGRALCAPPISAGLASFGECVRPNATEFYATERRHVADGSQRMQLQPGRYERHDAAGILVLLDEINDGKDERNKEYH